MAKQFSRQPANIPWEQWLPLWKENTKWRRGSKPQVFCEPFETLFRIQRGLAGHVSFLATCDANIVFTEYLLYEPILSILRHRKYHVACEVPWAGPAAAAGGDPRRLDFVAAKGGQIIALEIKWLRWGNQAERDYLDIKRDTGKLVEARKAKQAHRCFLCVFGRHSQIAQFRGAKVQAQIAKYDEALPPLYADFRRTIFGSRIFELKANQVADP
jgi:hypothetical protein